MKLPYDIDVDLDVFKALTALIQEEGQSHNDVLRELLSLDSPTEADISPSVFPIENIFAKNLYAGQFYSRGLVLPSGTELRARYKGEQHFATIIDGKWIDSSGDEQSSPSSAAKAITGNSVNGWRFWEAKRPGDRGWRRLDILNAK